MNIQERREEILKDIDEIGERIEGVKSYAASKIKSVNEKGTKTLKTIKWSVLAYVVSLVLFLSLLFLGEGAVSNETQIALAWIFFLVTIAFLFLVFIFDMLAASVSALIIIIFFSLISPLLIKKIDNIHAAINEKKENEKAEIKVRKEAEEKAQEEANKKRGEEEQKAKTLQEKIKKDEFYRGPRAWDNAVPIILLAKGNEIKFSLKKGMESECAYRFPEYDYAANLAIKIKGLSKKCLWWFDTGHIIKDTGERPVTKLPVYRLIGSPRVFRLIDEEKDGEITMRVD